MFSGQGALNNTQTHQRHTRRFKGAIGMALQGAIGLQCGEAKKSEIWPGLGAPCRHIVVLGADPRHAVENLQEGAREKREWNMRSFGALRGRFRHEASGKV